MLAQGMSVIQTQILILAMFAVCPARGQQNAIKYLSVEMPQRDVKKKELVTLLRRGMEIMASEEHQKDRNKIMGMDDEEALYFITFNPMGGGAHVSDFRLRRDMFELLQKIRKAAGLQMRSHLGTAPRLLGKAVLNSLRLQEETMALMVDKARRDDRTFGIDLFITEPEEVRDTPKGTADKKEVMPLLKHGIEIMAGEECAADRKKILEFDDEEDALDYVMFFSEFHLRGDARLLIEKIQETEKFNASLGAAGLLLYNVVLNSVRLQESATMLIVYEERRRDRSFRAVLSETPPPPPLR
jgi:hypothetical protein